MECVQDDGGVAQRLD